jgi:hypothetical protein
LRTVRDVTPTMLSGVFLPTKPSDSAAWSRAFYIKP